MTRVPAISVRTGQTGALLDRLTCHVHLLELSGDSNRLTSSRQCLKDKEASK